MANVKLSNGRGKSIYLKATGAGTDVDPYIVDTGATLTAGGDATAANQTTQITSLQLIDDTVATAGSAITTKGQAVAGTDGTNARIVKTDSSGELQVDVLTLPDNRESWRISTLNFTTTDDSDNTFTVPATTEYQILSIYVSLATTGTAGNRQMAVQALDASDNILIGARAGATQAASLTRSYNFAPGLPQDTAFRDTDYLAVSLPPIFLTAGQKLRVYDKAAIAAAADDMVVRVQIASRSIA